MAGSTLDSIQILADVGILHTVPYTDVLKSRVAVLHDEYSPLDLAGSLHSGSDIVPEIPTLKRQPPLFWKALGFFMKSKFTNSGSLYDDKRALFIGGPGQAGVPEGTACPQEVTNYQLFIEADTMQTLNRPSFSLAGGSYFEFLALYLKYAAEKDEATNLAQARKRLTDAKLQKDQKWEAGCAAFADASTISNPDGEQSLIDYFSADKDYIAAWNTEEAAQEVYSKLETPAMASLIIQLNLVRLADMRLEFQNGNNMPVVAVSEDWITKMKSQPDLTNKNLVDPKLVYYRPAYSLPNFETVVDYWISSNAQSSTIVRDGPYAIPLGGIWDRSWEELGHPLLDDVKPPQMLTEDQKNFINSLQATITFIQKPYVGDVDAGCWCVNEPRKKFRLSPKAPSMMRQTVCRTSKMIIAWGIEIEITLPEMAILSAHDRVTLTGMDLPCRASEDGKKLFFQAGGDSYPLLLGVIADLV